MFGGGLEFVVELFESLGNERKFLLQRYNPGLKGLLVHQHGVAVLHMFE
jgi:hypothetical protein